MLSCWMPIIFLVKGGGFGNQQSALVHFLRCQELEPYKLHVLTPTPIPKPSTLDPNPKTLNLKPKSLIVKS